MTTTKILKKLGYTFKVLSFGIDVFKDEKMVFHGTEEEVIDWLIENGEIA
jgi:hypothetical protein